MYWYGGKGSHYDILDVLQEPYKTTGNYDMDYQDG